MAHEIPRDLEVNPPADGRGLCHTCRHAETVRSARGSTFIRCRMSDANPRFPKYPRLPVLICDGYAPDPARRGQ